MFSKLEIENIFDELKKRSCSTIVLSGGEPLCHPEITEILKCTRGFSEVILVSNGTLINDESADILSQYVHKVQISLDGTNSTENDKIRGVGSFEKAITGIRTLRMRKVNIVVNYVITNYEIEDIEVFIEKMIDLGVSEINFSLLNEIGRSKENRIELKGEAEKYLYLMNILLNLSNKFLDKIKITIPSICEGTCPLLLSNNKLDISMRIGFTGDVYICQRLKNDPLLSIGNINQESLSSIFISLKLDSIINLLGVATKFVRKCQSCTYDEICTKPCPADVINSNIFEYSDGLCEIRKRRFLCVDN